MSSILVTGGSGLIGSQTIEALNNAGRHPIIYSRSQPIKFPVTEFYQGDVNDSEKLARLFSTKKITAVIHLAGKTGIAGSIQDPLRYYDDNLVATINLLKLMHQFNINKLVFASSAAVYGNNGLEIISESAPTTPQTPYGKSKLMAENIIRDFADRNLDFKYLILRYFNIAGADTLIKSACEAALGLRSTFTIFGNQFSTPDGTCIRDIIHIKDIAAINSLAVNYLEKNVVSNRVINCGTGGGYSVKQIIDAVKKITRKDFEVVVSDNRGGDLPRVISDNNQLQKILQYTPHHSTLEEMITFVLANLS